MKRIPALLCALCLLCVLGACASGQSRPAEAELFAMDTVMRLTAYGDSAQSAVDGAAAELNRLEALLSRTRGDSAVARLNGAGGAPVELGAELPHLLAAAAEYSAATSGAFDITLAPVSSAWGFGEDAYRVPSPEELEGLLAHVGMEHLHLSFSRPEDSVCTAASLDPGAQIDLGAIAKGYAADRLEAVFAEYGVTGALADLGGNIYARGAKAGGSPWRVGVRDPADPGALAGVLALTDAFAVTSGGYQRYFEQDGETYHHILDPATGRPADGGLLSVTVVAAAGGGSGALCDAFSTALYVLGERRALDFWRGGAYAFDLVLVTQDGRVLVTEGLENQFEQEAASGYVYEIIRRSAA